MDGLTGNVTCTLQRGGDFRELQGITVQGCLPAVRARGSFHPHERRGGHLSACHAIDGIVDEDDGDMFSPVQGMDAFSCTDARQVAITLIGEDQTVGPQAFDGAGHGRSTPVGGFYPIHVYVIIGKNGTADRRDGYGLILHTHFFDDFGH